MSDHRLISVANLRALFDADAEFALIDPREQGIFERGHLLAASNIPLSRLDLLVTAAVPDHATHIVLTDDLDGTAERAAARLAAAGYFHVSILDGGLAAWALAGGALFGGVNVIGKAFGEYVEANEHTPTIDSETLKARIDSGAPTFIVDSRTPAEHHHGCLPGAASCPGAELVHRAAPVDLPPDTLVVVHCAGRTRSIIGAQSLRNAGMPNTVVSFENGTMAWKLAGFELEAGSQRRLDPPSGAALDRARAYAGSVAKRFGVDSVDADTVAKWQADTTRTLYVFDVRSVEEYEAGTWPGARHVPGGQLVQNVDRYLVTRKARVVLVDPEGTRAQMSASWLTQMGYRDVVTFSPAPASLVPPPPEPMPVLEPATISPADLRTGLDSGDAVAVDTRRSPDFRRGHIPGAWFFTRAWVEHDAARLPAKGELVLIGEDTAYINALARDLVALGRTVRVLEDGMAAWRDAGFPVESGTERLASLPVDVNFMPADFDDPEEIKRECLRYLDWEIALVHQLHGDPGAPYANG